MRKGRQEEGIKTKGGKKGQMREGRSIESKIRGKKKDHKRAGR
jgi:hypothetical protein